MTKFKEMSHAEAVRLDNRPEFNRPSLNGCFEYIGQDYEMNDRGVAQKVARKVLVDPKVEMAKYRVSDFALENIIAAGAEGNLKEMSLQMAPMAAADMADRLMDSIENELNNNVNNTVK